MSEIVDYMVELEWCTTCDGTGIVHLEGQHGVPDSGGDFTCPDCGKLPMERVDYE